MADEFTLMLAQAFSAYGAGKLVEAERQCQRLTIAKPDLFDALHLLAVVQSRLGKKEEALASFDRAIEVNPDHAEALSNRGATLHDVGRFDEALANFERAIGLRTDYAKAHYNRGITLHRLGRLDEALSSYDRALSLRPDHAEVSYNRGIALHELKRLDEALGSYDRALKLRPAYAEALSNRGVVLYELKRFHDALVSYDRALTIRPDYAEALHNRGNTLQELKRFDEALASYDKALALEPNYGQALNGRGNILLNQGRIDEALVSYRRALAIKADQFDVHSNLIFACNFDPAATAADHQAERARWDERHARQFAAAARPLAHNADPNRRLRIGYVSSHFRHQAATYAFGGVLLCHDPKSFEVVCYSDCSQEDHITARLRAGVEEWHDTVGLSDQALADLIREHRVDILVDCVGHMRGHRLLVFARKPAPIQVTAWGEPTGTGLKVMDYLLADPVLVPKTERALLVEHVVDLPNFLGYWVPDQLPEPGALPALARGYVTFGSFNRRNKMPDPVLRVWASMLRALPNAHLVLKDQMLADSGQRARIESMLVGEGVTAERIKLLGPSDRVAHFAAYREIDIALDPFPHGGGMTTLDALWMGVPVVTCPGRTISSRLAAASLTALGLNGFIADSVQNYTELAVAKAADLDGLSRLRAGLRRRLADSEFGDGARYARAVERAYRDMWRRWCDAQARPSH
jgi:predicted O-linked N-acetylglucosamine transferase (SPINDLY family)